MNWEAYMWMGLMVAFLVAEAACPLHLISVWFAAGSLAAMVTAILGGAMWLQVTVFLVVSAALLALLWPFVQKFLKPRQTKTNLDSVIGSEGLVTADIDNICATGQVKLGSMEWTARSTSGETIPAGTRIRVDKIEGVKVFVSPAEVKV